MIHFDEFYKLKESAFDVAQQYKPNLLKTLKQGAVGEAGGLLPGATLARVIGKYVYDLFFQKDKNLSNLLSQHYQKLKQLGLDPIKVLHFDDKIIQTLSEESVKIILNELIKELNTLSQQNYSNLPKTNLVTHIACNYIRNLDFCRVYEG